MIAYMLDPETENAVPKPTDVKCFSGGTILLIILTLYDIVNDLE